MINLLPVEKKNKVNAEQKMRVVNAYLYMLGSCFVLALISLLPSYFPAVVKNHISHQKLNDLNNLPVSQLDQETNVVVQDVNSKIALIDTSEQNKFLVLESAINEIMSKKLAGIKISSFDYDKDKVGNKKVIIHGIATNRTELLNFRQALEADKNFSSVDLPISNFAKGSNIDFILNLTFGPIIPVI